MSKRIHKYVFYTMITIVYAVFFSVESFYNFEGHSDVRKILSHASLVRHAAANGGVTTSSSQFPSSHTIRLNKRYQQENYTPSPIFRVETPVCYIETRTTGTYPVCFLPHVTMDHSFLRGPPVAA